MENLLPQNWVKYNYQLLAVMLLKEPNRELPVEVGHSQLQTMASEAVDPIDLPLLPPYT